MLRLRLIHTVTVERATHTIAGLQKQRAFATVATGVPCLVQPISSVESVTLLGQGSDVTYQVFFDGTADVESRDQLTWGTRKLEVVALQKHFASLGSQPRIVEAQCRELA